MLTHARENGFAQEMQRIELEFAAQRSSLQQEIESFARWQSAWEARQQAIDAALAQLKSRLHTPKRPFAGDQIPMHDREYTEVAC